MVRSATAALSTPGVLQSAMPLLVRKGTSKASKPTEVVATTLRLGAMSTTC